MVELRFQVEVRLKDKIEGKLIEEILTDTNNKINKRLNA